jgi:hypothetical protein
VNGIDWMPDRANVSCTQPTEPFQTSCEAAGMKESKKWDRNGPVTIAASYSSPIVSYISNRKSR